MDSLKKYIYLFLILIFSFSYGQKKSSIEGQYYFGDKQIYLYIFPDNRFVAIGASTVAIGIASVQDNALVFNPIHPKSEYQLYGRKTSGPNRLIITDQEIFENGIYVNLDARAETLRLINKNTEENCNSENYFMPFQNKPEELVVRNDADVLNSFPVDKAHNDLLLFFLQKEQDISSLNGIIKIKNGEVVNNDLVRKTLLQLGNTTDIEAERPENILAKFDKIYSVFDQNTIYLDEDYHAILNKIDLSQYSFNKNKNQYEKKAGITGGQDHHIIYAYVKIKQQSVKDRKYITDRQNSIEAKCLKSSKILMEEKKQTENNQSNPPLPVESAPLKIK